MNASTHTIGAVAAGTLSVYISSTPIHLLSLEGAVLTAGAIAGGLLPDICQPFSWAGRRAGVLSKLISKIFGHRTLTHSLIFMFALYLITNELPGAFGKAIHIGLISGVISHILLDMLTSRGVALLYPVKLHIRFPLTTRTGSLFGEGIISLIMLSWIIYYIAEIA